MRVILDCNVVVSSAWNDGPARRVLRHVVTHHSVLVSPAILSEYERVCGYPKLAGKRTVLAGIIAEIRRGATLVVDAPPSITLPDAKDIVYVMAAIEGRADILLTGNLRHFPERTYGATRILSVRAFAELAGLAP